MRRRDRITYGLAIGALALSVLALGGAPRWAVCSIAVLAAAAAACQLTSQRGLTGGWPLLALLGVATGLTALQLVPLPVALLEALNPIGHSLRAGTEALSGAPRWFAPISLDPASTRVELLELTILVALAWVGLRLATGPAGCTRLIAVVAAAAAAVSLLAIAHQILGLDKLYGVYQPKQASSFYLGPLLNKNNQASLLALGAALSAGLALRSDLRRDGRVLWGGALLICLVGCLLMKSRGGAIALAVGLGATGLLWLAQRMRGERATARGRFMTSALPAGVIVLCSLALAVHFSATGVSSQLAETDVALESREPRSKFAAWRSSETLVAESPWVGVGRGAFESAFTRVHPASARLTYSYLENEYLQALVDWGVPGALALALLGVWLALAVARRWNEGPVAAGAIGGVLAIAAQSFVDFGVELLGVAVPVALVLAALLGKPLDVLGAGGRRRLMVVRGALLGLMAAATVAASGPWGRLLREDQAILRGDLAPAERVRLGREALERHPLDYFAAAQTASALLELGDPAALRWLNWAMLLHPTHSGLHRIAGRVLRASNRGEQALVEYALSLRSLREPREVVSEILAAFPRAADALRALPVDPVRPSLMATTLVELGRPDVAIGFLQRTLEQGGDPALLPQLADLAEAQRDVVAAESAARRLFASEATVDNGVRLARDLIAAGKRPEADALLRALLARPGVAGPERLELMLIAGLVTDGKWVEARTALHSLRERPGVSNATLIAVQRHLVEVAEKTGDTPQADKERRVLNALGGR